MAEAQVTFDDAAVYFSEEQWRNLEDIQKKVYKELMIEIYETMISLGYRIPKPEIVCRIERGEEPCSDYCKKAKLLESQPQGLPAGSKDCEPAIKTEPVSPGTCRPPCPVEISSTQERNGGLPCQACGTNCNNQCGPSHPWNAQGMYLGSPVDGSQGAPCFNGSASSPGFANRPEGATQPTSPLSPHYTGYRTPGEPSSPYALNERLGRPMFGSYETNHQSPLGTAGNPIGSPEQENRTMMEQYMRESSQAMHPQDRRNSGPPCPSCGAFCNNQCGLSFQWEQKRPVNAAPYGADGNRYTSPPNPSLAAASSHFPNGRPGARHGTPPGNAQGNMAMIQLSSHYAGYRRPNNPTSPNVLPPRTENASVSLCSTGGHAGVAYTWVQSQGNRCGVYPNSGNQRRSQASLSATETVSVFNGNAGAGAANEQRARQPPPAVSSSIGNRNKGGMNQNPAGKQTIWRFLRQCAGQSSANNSKPLPPGSGGATSPSTTLYQNNSSVTKSAKQSPSPNTGQESGRAGATASQSDGGRGKRAGPPLASDCAPPTKRASPPIIIIDGQEENGASPPVNAGNGHRFTPPAAKPANPAPGLSSGSQDVRNTALPENKDGNGTKRPWITISSIRSAGVFGPPSFKSRTRETGGSTSPIIIIDDGENKESSPPRSAASAPSNESKSSSAEASPAANVKPSVDPPTQTPVTKIQAQNAPQGNPVLVNNIQMQQPSNIIVTGNPGLGNSAVPVSVNGNQSIMLTFPVTVSSSGIMLATPMKISENQVAGMKPVNRVTIGKNPRPVQTNTAPRTTAAGTRSSTYAPVTLIGQTNMSMAPSQAKAAPVTLIGQTNMSLPSGQAKPVTIGVNQKTTNLVRNPNVSNASVQKVNNTTLKAVPVKMNANQGVGQAIPVFMGPNSGIILTGPTVANKDSSGNPTVVRVNGNVVTGNVTLGGKLAFGKLTPVTPIFTVNNALGIRNGVPVTLTSNPTTVNNNGTLSINNHQILTLNGGVSVGRAGTAGNTGSVNTTAGQAGGMVLRKLDEPSAPPNVQRTVTNTEPPRAVTGRPFKCDQCEVTFSTVERLNSHQKIHRQPNHPTEGPSKETSENEALGKPNGDSPTILYTTQGDDGSTVYVVTV
ncbi:nascent polypeptide-associated complex subunit alpha, muscle-specific form-like [Spea bombifrons]|uniref:nascent polypeptide-associated complex subunit alpha, muscle-specific form-like n=1 Tax=Spea bombifrons TaxID=233779 RepID=UPI00234BAE55|nr:nascent polypeptide-associated complex subunit alpha, muscle-specific form-like [Spea bombifrons]